MADNANPTVTIQNTQKYFSDLLLLNSSSSHPKSDEIFLTNVENLKKSLPSLLHQIKSSLSTDLSSSKAESLPINSKLLMWGTLMDILSIGNSTNFKNLPLTLKFVMDAFKNDLQKSANFITSSILYLKSAFKNLEMSSDSVKKTETEYICRCIFQYCSQSMIDLTYGEVDSLLSFLQECEFDISSSNNSSNLFSSIILISLVSYIDRVRSGDLLEKCKQCTSWKSEYLKNSLLFSLASIYLNEELALKSLINNKSLEFFQLQSKKFYKNSMNSQIEFYKFVLETIRNIFAKFLIYLPKVVRKIKNDSESLELKNSYTTLISNDLFLLIDILCNCYAIGVESHADAISIDLAVSDFCYNNSKLFPFFSWLSESNNPVSISAFLHLLICVSKSFDGSKILFEMSQNGQLRILNWNIIFASLDKYVEVLNDSTSMSISEQSKNSDFCINPIEHFILLQLLELTSLISTNLEDFRNFLFQPKQLNTLISILCCKIPIDFKSGIIKILRAFSVDLSKGSIILSFLQKSQILFGILQEIKLVEQRQQRYTESIEFLKLILNLVRSSSVSKESSYRFLSCDMVFDKIFASLTNFSDVNSKEKYQIASLCFQVFLSDLNSSLADRFVLNTSNATSVMLFDLFKPTDCVGSFFYWKECVFWAVHFIYKLLDFDKRFFDVCFSKSQRFCNIFLVFFQNSIGIESSVSSLSESKIIFFILKILSISVKFSYFDKISKMLEFSFGRNNLLGALSSPTIKEENVFFKFLSEKILAVEGPPIGEQNIDMIPADFVDESDFTVLNKIMFLNLIIDSLASYSPSKYNENNCNFFVYGFFNSRLLLESLINLIKNSIYPAIVELALKVLVLFLELLPQTYCEQLVRDLKNSFDFFNFLSQNLCDSISSGLFKDKNIIELVLKLFSFETFFNKKSQFKINNSDSLNRIDKVFKVIKDLIVEKQNFFDVVKIFNDFLVLEFSVVASCNDRNRSNLFNFNSFVSSQLLPFYSSFCISGRKYPNQHKVIESIFDCLLVFFSLDNNEEGSIDKNDGSSTSSENYFSKQFSSLVSELDTCSLSRESRISLYSILNILKRKQKFELDSAYLVKKISSLILEDFYCINDYSLVLSAVSFCITFGGEDKFIEKIYHNGSLIQLRKCFEGSHDIDNGEIHEMKLSIIQFMSQICFSRGKESGMEFSDCVVNSEILDLIVDDSQKEFINQLDYLGFSSICQLFAGCMMNSPSAAVRSRHFYDKLQGWTNQFIDKISGEFSSCSKSEISPFPQPSSGIFECLASVINLMCVSASNLDQESKCKLFCQTFSLVEQIFSEFLNNFSILDCIEDKNLKEFVISAFVSFGESSLSCQRK